MNFLTEEGKTVEEVQEERREYVKTIGIEYRFGCYKEHRADSCHLLAEYKEAIELNLKSAYSLYRENCEERKYAKSCLKFAKYLLSGKECEPSITKTIQPLEIACNAKIPQACRLLALAYWNGEDEREPDSRMAEKYQKKACDLGDGEACWTLSTWYMGPKARFRKLPSDYYRKERKMGALERDMEKSIEFGIRACDNNIPQACSNVARIFKIGDGVPKNPDKAKEYIDKAKEISESIKDGFSTGFTA